jgi:DNA-binding transcriptional LysR family regulator
MMALAQLAESDLIATLPRHLVEQHAARFHLVARPMPFRWTAEPVRVVASQAAMADAGIAWLFEVLTSCFSPHQLTRLTVKRSRSL